MLRQGSIETQRQDRRIIAVRSIVRAQEQALRESVPTPEPAKLTEPTKLQEIRQHITLGAMPRKRWRTIRSCGSET